MALASNEAIKYAVGAGLRLAVQSRQALAVEPAARPRVSWPLPVTAEFARGRKFTVESGPTEGKPFVAALTPLS